MRIDEIEQELKKKKSSKEISNQSIIEISERITELKCDLKKQIKQYEEVTNNLISSIPTEINITRTNRVEFSDKTKRFLSVFLGICFAVSAISISYAFEVYKTREEIQEMAYEDGLRTMGFLIYEKTKVIPKTQNWLKKNINNEYLFNENSR